jgi:hypothetical protein
LSLQWKAGKNDAEQRMSLVKGSGADASERHLQVRPACPGLLNRACSFLRACEWYQFSIAQSQIDVRVVQMLCETGVTHGKRLASERREKFEGTEIGGLRTEVCGRADRQHDDRPEHKNAEVCSGVNGSGFMVIETRVISVDSADWIVVGIFNSPLERRTDRIVVRVSAARLESCLRNERNFAMQVRRSQGRSL